MTEVLTAEQATSMEAMNLCSICTVNLLLGGETLLG